MYPERASSHSLAHTLVIYLSSHGESCNSQLGISLTKEEEGQLGGQSRCRGKEIKISFKRDLTLYHPSLILPYNCYLYILCLKKKKKTTLFIDWAVAQAFSLSSCPRSCKINLTKPMLWNEATFTGSPLKIRSSAQGSRVLHLFLFLSAAPLSCDLGEEFSSAKKEIRDKKAVPRKFHETVRSHRLNTKPELPGGMELSAVLRLPTLQVFQAPAWACTHRRK